MNRDVNVQLDRILNRWPLENTSALPPQKKPLSSGNKSSLSYLFFSDVRKDISDHQKYKFTRTLVEFADQSGFEAVYFQSATFMNLAQYSLTTELLRRILLASLSVFDYEQQQ